MIARPFALLLASTLALATTGCPGDSGGGTAKTAKSKSAKSGAKSAAKKAPPKPKKPFNKATAKTLWAKVKVGQWADYKMGSNELHFEVTEVSDSEVTWTVTRKGGSPNKTTYQLADKEDRHVDVKSLLQTEKDTLEDKEVEIAGKKLKVKVLKRNSGDGSKTENWLTDAIPPFNESGGMASVKSIKDGGTQLELVDWGQK